MAEGMGAMGQGPRRYRIQIRDTRKHGAYRTVASDLTAAQTQIMWKGQTAFNGWRARLLEFDGYRERVIAVRDERGDRFPAGGEG